MDINEEALARHREWKGKVKTVSSMPVQSRHDLSVVYTPGVAEPCRAIHKNPEEAYALTGKGNTIAVISDGTAVLGLGDIGPLAGLPVMEGKCVLFHELGGLNAIPLVLDTKDVDELVRTIEILAPSFGGINLEDISAPRCFEVEARLQDLGIPVFHDDQHGTAIVVAAAMKNALAVAQKTDPVIVINGAGSAGCAIARLLLDLELGDVILCDRQGILAADQDLTPMQRSLLPRLNKGKKTGTLADAMAGADVFVGVSAPNVVTESMVSSMAERPIVFAMANPDPEITPDKAAAAGAYIVGTGRSDYPNQINNVLAFPGIFKGALQAEAVCINEAMKKAAVEALANCVKTPSVSCILPDALDPGVADAVAAAVADAAVESGVVRHG